MKRLKRDEIFYLPEDEWKKGVWRFKQMITFLLMDELGDQFSQDKIVDIAERITRCTVDFSLYARGLDKEIKIKGINE